MKMNNYSLEDRMIDLIYSTIDLMLKNGRFSDIDVLLDNATKVNLQLPFLLALLVSTLPAKTHLPARNKLLKYAHYGRCTQRSILKGKSCNT